MKKISLSIIALIIIASFLPSLYSFAFAAYNKTTAKTYLENHSTSPWATMGLLAMGADNIPLDHLKNISGDKAIDFTAPILAITASGNDPRTFGNEDLIAKLKTYHQQNQIGDASTVNDDIFGLLALISAGEPLTDTAIVDAKNFILQSQKPSGGWGFAASGGADSNITAASIVALKAAGLSAADAELAKALDYLKTSQNNDGGFTYDPESSFGTDSDSSSTAWVLWALNALSIDEASWTKNGNTPSKYLASTQTSQGDFEWQIGAGENSFSPVNTSYAVIALEGKTLPLKIVAPIKKQFNFRIEGSQETVCQGKTEGPTALDIVKNASQICSFAYHIKDTSFGPYLDKINSDEAEGVAGFMYWVNFTSPAIGAADYALTDGDEVLWAFGNFDVKPLRLNLDDAEIDTGSSAQATVEYIDGTWKPLEVAKVLVGAQEFTTSSNGKTAISGPDGFYQTFAEKSGYVRSNKVLLKIGTPASSSINLSVNIGGSGGQVGGASTTPSIAFSIEPSSLDFGNLPKGGSVSKTLTLKNTGSSNLEFESNVQSGQLFKENLKLDGKIWQQFKKDVNASSNQNVQASLTIPTGAQAGVQNGVLIFWASPK